MQNINIKLADLIEIENLIVGYQILLENKIEEDEFNEEARQLQISRCESILLSIHKQFDSMGYQK